jgi:flavodoxin
LLKKKRRFHGILVLIDTKKKEVQVYEVIYFSRGGSTQKLASTIAAELNVQARHVQLVKSLPEKSEIFLGSGLYFMRPARMVREFIRDHDFQGRRIVLFGTSNSGINVETLWMEVLLKRKGAVIIGKYHCAGKFAFRLGRKRFCLRGGRPSDKDLEKAREFACSMKNKYQSADNDNAAIKFDITAHSGAGKVSVVSK